MLTAPNIEQLRRDVDAARPLPKPPGGDDAPAAPRRPELLDLRALSSVQPAQPEALIAGMLHVGYATLLSADGGTGKSQIALHLGACVALGRSVWGLEVKQVRVAFFSFEDRKDVLHWRLAHICRHLGVPIERLHGNLFLFDGVDVDATMFTFDSREGPKTTALHQWACDEVARVGARLVVIDGVSDVNASNENERAAVKQFVRKMMQITGPNGSVLLIAHVNKDSARAGDARQGYSGSTAWNGAVRARWYLRQMTDGESNRAIPGQLTLELQKSNLGPTGRTIGFRWNDEAHLFLPTETAAADAKRETERNGALHDWIVEACADADRRGDAIPAAMSGARTAASVLAARQDCPKELSGKANHRRAARIIEELRADGRLVEERRERPGRKYRECLVLPGMPLRRSA